MAYAVSNLVIRAQAGSAPDDDPLHPQTYYATWDFTPPQAGTLRGYWYTWFYWMGDYKSNGEKLWFIAEEVDPDQSGNSTSPAVLYSPPDNAKAITIHVIPASTYHEVNGQQTEYWQGELRGYELSLPLDIPKLATPPTPEVTVDKLGKVTITVGAVDSIHGGNTPSRMYIMIYDGPNGTSFYDQVYVPMSNGPISARYSFQGTPGNIYRARAQHQYEDAKGTWYYSDFTDWSGTVSARPDTPRIIECRADSSTSVYLAWSGGTGATSYTIYYSDNPSGFAISGDHQEITGIEAPGNNVYIITGLETGTTYYFYVIAVNDNGESAYSNMASCTIGKDPEAPTTWSSTTTAIVGQTVNLYFVHNSEDGSNMSEGQVEVTFNDKTQTFTVQGIGNDPQEDQEETTYHYTINTSTYGEGKLTWRARTSGVTGNYGPWSVVRTVDIYEKPSISISVTDAEGTQISTITSYPFKLTGVTTPSTQKPIGFSVSILAAQSYQTIDYEGNTVYIQAGDSVYSNYIPTSPLNVEFGAQDVNLDSGQNYTVSVVVSMNSGLTASATYPIACSWSESTVRPNCEISLDRGPLSTYVSPYIKDDTGSYISGYTLSVYRREFDGALTEIATGLDSSGPITVVDPHPPLDAVRYRIVAISNTTGAVDYTDLPAYPIHGICIVIQWDEEWQNLRITQPDRLVERQYRGSLLRLPFNIDTTEDVTTDVELVNYIGRDYPTSYYGTVVNSTATWNTDIPDFDKETLYALRRLQKWKGDCYVREPSGTGYWASITVSFGITHLERAIPVTLNVTRVAGGM